MEYKTKSERRRTRAKKKGEEGRKDEGRKGEGRKVKGRRPKEDKPRNLVTCMMCFRIQILMTYEMHDRCSSVTDKKGLNFYLCSLVSLLLVEWPSGDPGATCTKGSRTSRCGDPSLHFHERDLQERCKKVLRIL